MAANESSQVAAIEGAPPRRELIYRHAVLVRMTHWINVLCLALLLMSGLQLFNYHPALYWGNDGHKGMPSFISITALEDIETDQPVGVTTIAGHNFITTGVLGVSYDASGEPVSAAFPNWLTLSDTLAGARDVHFAAAWLLVINGLVYLLFGLLTGHFRRDLMPDAAELRPGHLLADIFSHIRLRRARRAEAGKGQCRENERGSSQHDACSRCGWTMGAFGTTALDGGAAGSLHVVAKLHHSGRWAEGPACRHRQQRR